MKVLIKRKTVYLRQHATVLDLAGIQTLLVRVLHAVIYPRTAIAHGVDGTLIMEARPVGDDLKMMHRPGMSPGEPKRPACRLETAVGPLRGSLPAPRKQRLWHRHTDLISSGLVGSSKGQLTGTGRAA